MRKLAACIPMIFLAGCYDPHAAVLTTDPSQLHVLSGERRQQPLPVLPKHWMEVQPGRSRLDLKAIERKIDAVTPNCDRTLSNSRQGRERSKTKQQATLSCVVAPTDRRAVDIGLSE